MNTYRWCRLVALLLVAAPPPSSAHHSYAMFDLQDRRTVQGTVAKLEWTNPHTFVWMYVKTPKGYELFSFESGSVSMLRRYGWTPNTFVNGEKVTLEYFPLKDGRNGGVFIKATHADGRVTENEPDAPGGSAPSSFTNNKSTL